MGQEIFNLEFFFILQSFLVRNYSTDYVGECTMVTQKKDIIWDLGNETSI